MRERAYTGIWVAPRAADIACIRMEKGGGRVGGDKRECITFSELRCKDVINVCNGACLGRVCDIELERCECEYHLSAIILPGPARLWGIIRSEEELVISCRCITKIGDDVILVDLPPPRG